MRSIWLGRVRYDDGLRLQKDLVEARKQGGIEDTLLLLEHPPVVTLGKVANEKNLLADRKRFEGLGIQVIDVDRGGDVTYHGPGQLVGYPIVDLRGHRKDVKWYLEQLEAVLIDCLGQYGIEAERTPGMTGAWVPEGKIAAIGVRIERWVTRHGFALNVNTDLDPFDLIIPCGIRERGVTSMRERLGRELELPSVAREAAGSFGRIFGVDVTHEEKAGREEDPKGIEALLQAVKA